MSKFFTAIGFLTVIAGVVIAALMIWEKYKECTYEEEELEEAEEAVEEEVEAE